MKTNRRAFMLAVPALAASLLLSACAQPVAVPQVREVQVTVVVEATAAPNPDAVVKDVEPNAEITFWTFFLSPTFDDFIKKTIAEFEAAYPGVKVKWEDRQAKFLDEYRAAIAAGQQPDVANLSGGWVAEFAEKGLLTNMSEALPKEIQDLYFPDIFNAVNVGGSSYSVPWYQSVSVNLVSTDIISKAGYTLDDMPKNFAELQTACKDMAEKAQTPCGLALGGNILATMAYQGDVEVIKDGQYTFDNEAGVKWLQAYVDMVKNGHVVPELLTEPNDRVGLDKFAQGQIPWWASGPQLVRIVREANPGRYGYVAMVPTPAGKTGKYPPSTMVIATAKNSKFPNAAKALALWFTNPRNQLEFAKIVPIFPATPASYDDPFFTEKPVAIEHQVRPIAKEIIANQKNILPDLPMRKEVNDLLRTAFERAVFGGVSAADALKEAAAKANALIGK